MLARDGTRRTCVIVDEGVNMVEYELDEALIGFGSCLERKRYARAVDILEDLPPTLAPEKIQKEGKSRRSWVRMRMMGQESM